MTRRSRSLATLVGLVSAIGLGALALVACGVPTSGSADRVDPDDVPFSLLDQDREAATVPSPLAGTVVTTFVYDDETGALVPVEQVLEDPSLADVLAALEQTTNQLGVGEELENPLGETAVFSSAETSRGVATIDLTEDLSDISGANQLVAIAQIVYTATARPGIGQVGFALEGEPIEVPRGDGALTSGAVTRSDYPSFAPI